MLEETRKSLRRAREREGGRNAKLEEDGLTPFPSIHRTLSFTGLGIDPFEQAVHVKDVRALSPD